jgi:uncharacterized membrane protein HdeD (DUF308 family)
METTATQIGEAVGELARRWWLLVAIGVGWMLYGFVVLSFTYRTVWAVAVFAGVWFLVSGVTEIAIAVADPGWRWAHVILGVLGIVAGLLALLWPEATFLVLARVVGWFLLISGIVSLVTAFASRSSGHDLWWISLLIGTAEILTALWAVRYPGRSIVLLVLWVGVGSLARGVSDIVLGFRIRELRDPGERGGTGPRPAVA